MHFVFTLARLYPYWAISIAFVLFELGVFFKRRSKPYRKYCWGAAAVLLLGLLAWVYFRGDLNSDHWLRTLGG